MPVGTARPRGRPEWSDESLFDSPPKSGKPSSTRFVSPQAWQTPALRLGEARKSASTASAAGDHREALRCLLRCIALAKVHTTAVTSAGGRLSRDEATSVARTHIEIATLYETSKGFGLCAAGETSADADALANESRNKNGLTQAVVHLQHAIGACSGACVPPITSSNTKNNNTSSEAITKALEETKLAARTKLGPRLLAIGRVEDAAETTRRALDTLPKFEDKAVAKHINLRIELLLCAADAERLAGERLAKKARASKLKARAVSVNLVQSNADVELTASLTGGVPPERAYALKSKLARDTAEMAEMYELECATHTQGANARFATCEKRLDAAESAINALGSDGATSSGTTTLHPKISEVLTRRRDLRRCQKDWIGAAALVSELLQMAIGNGDKVPGSSHDSAFAIGALHGELAELFVRAKQFDVAKGHAENAVHALMEYPRDSKKYSKGAPSENSKHSKHTAASLNACGTLGFITARCGDFAGAAEIYRSAIQNGLNSKIFTETSPELGNLEAALGSVRFSMSEGTETGDDEGGDESGDDVSDARSENSQSEKAKTSKKAPGESTNLSAHRNRRLDAIAALEEALGCFIRAVHIESLNTGSYSSRVMELELRVEETQKELHAERSNSEHGAEFL